MTKSQSYHRGREILAILAEYGPLSVQGVESILVPKMERRQIRTALCRLHKNGLTQKRYDGIFRDSAVFHEITQNPLITPHIAKTLEMSEEALERKYPRHAELLHWQECSVWAARFRRLFPNAKIYRDFQFPSVPVAKQVLLAEGNDFEVFPDLLIVLPPEKDRLPRVVAIEIERTRKSAKRIHRKIYKYTNQTTLDGVLYICNSEAILKNIHVIYRSKVLARALRIKHYGNNFMLFSRGAIGWQGEAPLILNSAGENIRLEEWIRYLTENHRNDRRDPNFPVCAPQGHDRATPH